MTHHYGSTSEAYGACQCDEEVKNGDTLVIEAQCVVGLAWTWPVAVTLEFGARNGLHTITAETDLSALAKDAGWTPQAVAHALAEADAHGWLDSRWRALATAV